MPVRNTKTIPPRKEQTKVHFMNQNARGFTRGLGLLAAVLCSQSAAHAQDVATVATVVTSGSAVTVPLYVRDVGGTPLGRDQATGSRIQGLSFRVAYAPSSAVASISIARAGITASLIPMFETTVPSGNTISYIGSFNESTSLIPFTLDGAAPGDQVLQLSVNLSASATAGTVITLAIDPSPAVTVLSNQSGSLTETSSNGNLTLVDGSITVVAPPPVVSGVSPNNGPTTGGTPVSISGSGFQPGAGVSIGGIAAIGVTINGATSISATTPPHAAGAASVVVTNPDTQTGALVDGFTYTSISTSSADLAITKTDSADPVQVGTSFQYQVSISNNGPDTATSAMITDALPATATFVSASATDGTWYLDGTTVVWQVSSLPKGGQSPSLIITVTPSVAGLLTNTASAGAAENDPVSSNNSATAETTIVPSAGGAPDLTALWNRIKRKGNTVRGQVQPRNIGDQAAGTFVVKIYYSTNQIYDAADKLVQTSSVNGLAAGATASPVKIKYKGKKSMKGKYLVAIVDADNGVGESNEGNNAITKQIP